MKMSEAFPSKYLRAADLQDRQHTLTMKLVQKETIADDEKKPVLYFEKIAKGLVLNKTNAKTISNSYGDDSDGWEGKPLTLFTAMVDYRGDQVEAIRVRVPKPAAPAKPRHVDPDPPPHDGAGLDGDEAPF